MAKKKQRERAKLEPRSLSWPSTILGEIAHWTSGGTPSASVKRYYDGDIPWLVIGDLNDGEVTKSQRTITQFGFENSNVKWVPIDAILIAMYGASIGKLGIAKIECTTNQAIAFTKKIFGKIPSKYIFYFLLKERENLISLGKGDAQQNISLTIINNYPIVLPPISIQNQIISDLDDLLGKVHQAQTLSDKIPSMIRAAKQKIIEEAAYGNLSKEWRNINSSETGVALLNRLIEERKKDNKSVKLNLDDLVIENSQIPSSWKWTRLINLADIVSGVTKGRKLKGKRLIKLPYLRVANVQDGYLDLSNIKFIEVMPAEVDKYLLNVGDILFTEGGDRDKLGRNAVWNGEVDRCIHQNHIIRARTITRYIIPEYLSIFTKSRIPRDYFFENANQTVNLASINQSTLSNVPIALPPLGEQKQIVKSVTALFVKLDSIEARYEKVQKRLGESLKAVLTMAFDGELSSPDSHAESATKLLETIKREKVEYLKEQKTISKLAKTKPKLKMDEDKLSLENALRSSVKRKTFTFDDVRAVFFEFDYMAMRNVFFDLIRKGVISMEYRPKQNEFIFSFVK